jgi:SAM-dependent methyltransferase
VTEYALKLSDAELSRYEGMAERALEHEGDRWAAAGVVEGAVVADIGCGPGAVAVVLARQVGPTGAVLAVDRGAQEVDTARALAERAGVTNVTVEVADADSTGVAPGSVDVAMIRHVLAHNGGREAAIVAHAASLVRPGGSVCLLDIDSSAVRSRPSDPDLDDLNDRYWRWHAQQGNDSMVGLRLHELLAGAGLEVVEYRGRYDIISPPPGARPPSWAARDVLVSSGLATADDVARWEAAFSRSDALDPRPTMFVPMFWAVGRATRR